MATRIFLRGAAELSAEAARASQEGAAPMPNIARLEPFRNALLVFIALILSSLKFRTANHQARDFGGLIIIARKTFRDGGTGLSRRIAEENRPGDSRRLQFFETGRVHFESRHLILGQRQGEIHT